MQIRPLTFTLLRELSADRFTSGAALATRHGISRSAISDALKDASALGVPIFSLTRRGYRLAEPLALLDIDDIRRRIDGVQHRFDLRVVDIIDSTNTALLAQAMSGAPSGTCLVAELQTAGRGRRGRAWHSAVGASLTFSLLWRFESGASSLGGLSLVVGLAVANALRALGLAAQLKWPNDILFRNQKLGGILIETQGDMLGPTVAVVGIGINVRLPDSMKAAIDQPVTDIAAAMMESAVTPPAMNRNALLAAVLTQLVALLDQFQRSGFAPLRDQWRALNAHQGQMVDVHAPNETYTAKLIDVALDGGLMVERNGMAVTLSAAEISVRAGR
jgi:BirA family biotin operon repressor/biotin-[acetyl-CoA-carboxylase] ligase